MSNNSSASNQPPKSVPKDAQVITSIFKDMGIVDYEPQVVTQLLDFTYRYVTTTLDDARVYAQHAGKKTLDTEDVQLAVQMQLDKNFTTPPPRDLLLEVARAKNTVPLPQIKPHCGIRLPPDRYCMTACNFELRPLKKATVPPKQTIFTANQKLNPIKRTMPTVSKTQTIVTTGTPKPVIKFTPGLPGDGINLGDGSGPQWKPVVVQTIMDVDEPPVTLIKKKHSDDN